VLQQAKALFSSDKKIAALILEPILSEGGDHRASPRFYNQLRNLCREHEIVFIVDEVQTGCMATGK